MYKILLKGLKFYVHLGHYENENAVGTEIIIDIELFSKIQNDIFENNINNVVNYQTVYNEIKEMLLIKSFTLIEVLATNVINLLYEKFNLIENIIIMVKKANIQICGEIDYIGVELHSTRQERLKFQE